MLSDHVAKVSKAGNTAGARSPFIQPKLTINSPGDSYEREADAMADTVMKMEKPAVESNANPASFFKPAPANPVQRKCAHCEAEEKNVQRKENSTEATADTGLENYVGGLGTNGQPLSSEARSFYEPRFGYDFSNVRVHTDQVAAKSAQSINALAYTSGNHIVFNSGQYSPGTDSGKRLLGHELTHVVQQGQGNGLQRKMIQRYSGCSSTQDTEINADHARARQMLSNAIAQVSAYNGTTPTKVHTALNRHFSGSTSNAFATWLNVNLRILWGLTWMAGYECFTGGAWESTWACRGRDLATTFWCVPTIAIRLCPSYFGQSDIEKSTTLIHEWVHKYGCNFDLGYEHEAEYSGNYTITQLLNADSFSSFIRDVQ